MNGLNRWSTGAALLFLGLIVASGFRMASIPTRADQSGTPNPQRLVEMTHHFTDVMLVHEAVIRGDLPAVKPPALRLAMVTKPERMPDAAAPFITAIQRAGKRAADSTTLAAAARATVEMVTACANCHRAVGVHPEALPSTHHDVGGVVGHMLEHQRAADSMLAGLMMPSPAEWRQGADQLRVAQLLPSKFPNDPRLTKQIRALDLQVHQLADQAIDAETADARADAYTQLITTCAQCHSLHSKIWGPGRGATARTGAR